MKKIIPLLLIVCLPLFAYAQKTQKNEEEIKSLFTQGVTLSEANKTDEAINVFLTLIKKYPDIPEPYNNLAVLYIEKNNIDMAIKALQEAIKIDPTYYVAKENLGDIYLKLASDNYTSSLKANPENKAISNKILFAQQALNNNTFETFNKETLVAKNETKTIPASDIKPDYTAKIQVAENTVVPVKTKPIDSFKSNVNDTNPIRPIRKDDDIVRLTPLAKEEPVVGTKVLPPSQDEAIKTFVALWSNSWQSKNVDLYLASYDNTFETPDGSSLEDWKKLRKERINKPASININISDISIEMINEIESIVTFKQSYKAGAYSDNSLKTLALVRKNQKWYIKREISTNI